MKYIILRCEDRGWREGGPSLFEGAKTVHLRDLFQAGAGGTIRSRQGAVMADRFALHRGLLGLSAHDASASAGLCYAASAKVALADGDTAWCAELLTQHDGKVTDAAAGGISTKESRILIDALNGQLAAVTRRWAVGDGSHHVLVVRDPSLQANGARALREPDVLVGQSWRRSLPRGPLREALHALIEQASKILDTQPVNRVRADLGENPANLLWLWGGAQAQPQRSFRERTGRSGAVVSNGFLLRGLARTLGLDWKPGPRSLEEAPIQHLTQTLAGLVERHALVELHLEIETEDPIERLCAMERIDQHLLKPVAERLPRLGPWRLMVVIDDRRMSGAIPVIAIGTDLPPAPVVSLTAEQLAASPLAFDDGPALFSWLTHGDMEHAGDERSRTPARATRS